jgi:signal peptide peptidase SppA
MSDRSYRHIVKFATSTPWMMIPETLELVCEVLTARISGDRWSDAEIAARIEAAGGRRTSSVKPTGGAVAVIPLMGVIVPRANLMTDLSGGTSVTDFMESFMAAVADPDISAIVLDVDSPGGSVDLIPESAARIRAARGTKPILAVSDTMMASAAYYLGSQADEVYVTPSGLIGSIGVYATHYDQSGLNEKTGVKPTLVSAGKYKTELNPNEAPSEEGIAHLQSIVDDAYQQFTLDVSKARGVSVADVRGGFGEGRVLPAKAGVKAGLADGILTREQTIGRAMELVSGRRSAQRAASAAFAADLDRAAAEEPPTPEPEDDPAFDHEGDTKTEPEAIGSAEAASIADQLDGALCATEDLVAQGRPLTAAKRERLEAIRDRVDDLLDAEPPMAAVGSAITEDDEAFWAGLVPTNHREE